MRRSGLLVLLLLLSGCSTTNYPPQPIPATPISPTPTPLPGVVTETIEFRIFGDIGSERAQVRYQDSTNGTTVLNAVSLPYLARVTSTDAATFLYLEATAPAPYIYQGSAPAVLQVQIVVNGIVFREGFATGYATLTATASGTWHR